MKAKYISTFLNNETEKLDTRSAELDLEYKGQLNCVKSYKIVKSTNKYFTNGEITIDLKKNKMYISMKFLDRMYEEDKEVIRNYILEKCDKHWRGGYFVFPFAEANIIDFYFL